MNRSHLKAWVLTGSIVSGLFCVQSIAAQVVPDNTLPAGERSQVTGNPNVQIDGGARRGGNLFHSFSQFSIPTSGSAYFNNAIDVQNIFSRVTGGSSSNIDGLIRANGTANLFLLNPNGILFGANASLNLGGSFVGTTASAIGFPNGEVFSSDATQPLPRQLLTVNPNALLFNQLAAQSIIHRSIANNGTGLQVTGGQSLLLVGGDVRLEGGQIVSPGSRVEFGAVAGQGSVGLTGTAGEWRLSFPIEVTRADISFNNNAFINVRSGGGGSITFTARNVTLSQKSTLWAGIADGLNGRQAGNIQFDATEAINLLDDSYVTNQVSPGSTGNSGDINITTGSLSALSNARLATGTFGQGNAGSLNIVARDIISWDGNNVISGTAVEPTGVGNAGEFNITTGSLSIRNGAKLGSVTRGKGNSGSVNIVARDAISMDGYDTFYSFIGSGVDATAVGNSGGINITTGSLSITNVAQIASYTAGQGNVGRVNINARDTVSFGGIGTSTVFDSTGVLAAVYEGGVGNSSGVSITTGSLFLLTGSRVASTTLGQGNAGSINIDARDTVSLENGFVESALANSIGQGGDINIKTRALSLTRGAQLISSTFGQGNAGSINIDARDTISIDGEDPTRENSAIFTQVNLGAVGRGGNITLNTGSLLLTNGGALYADNDRGTGDAGNITIHARDSVEIRGTAPTFTNLRSGVFATTPQGAVGRGGDIILTTGSLSVSDQGRISTRAQGQGRAGNIQIRAGDAVSFDGGDAISTLDSAAVGRGGDIGIEARSLSLFNGAQISASTAGDGNAGNITVKTPDLQLSGATSGLFAQTTSTGDAGNLTIQPRNNGQSVRVNLQDGAQISASTFSSGRGGELTIAAPDSITLTGNGSVIAAGTGDRGNGGNLNLRTRNLNIQNQAEVTVSSLGTGSAGNLFVDADLIFLNNGRIRADTSGGGGNIELRSPFILLRNGSNITTNATGANIPGGNLVIDTRFLVAVPQEDSNISANSEDFRGGNVSINAVAVYGIQPHLRLTPLSDITATGATSTLSGTVQLNVEQLDPTSRLAELPTTVVDSSRLIAQGCPANKGNSFVLSGRGGLLPTPEQQLDDDGSWQDRRRLSVAQQTSASTIHPSTSISPPAIIEATGWQKTPTGEVLLVATASDPAMQYLQSPLPACPGQK